MVRGGGVETIVDVHTLSLDMVSLDIFFRKLSRPLRKKLQILQLPNRIRNASRVVPNIINSPNVTTVDV